MHIPDDPHFYEKFYFTPGDLGFKTIQPKKGKIGTLICWDQWYEAARLTALQGAEVLFYPTAIGWHPQEKRAIWRKPAWRLDEVMKGHAVANGVYVAANRIGLEQYLPDTAGIQFWGSSFIAGPQGEILAKPHTTKKKSDCRSRFRLTRKCASELAFF
jgi:N-carbamoylputrescine amidase